jgi:hypothetical protein
MYAQASPKAVLDPRLYRQIATGQTIQLQPPRDNRVQEQLRIFVDQHAELLQRTAVMQQYLTDLEKRTEVDQAAASKIAERLVHLEDIETDRLKHEREAEDVVRHHWEAVMGWVRIVFATLCGLMANEFFKRWKDKRRRLRRESEVDAKLEEIRHATKPLAVARLDSSYVERHPHSQVIR